MQFKEKGKLIRGVGGLYEILLASGETPLSGQKITCRAKGTFRHEGLTPLVGDLVSVSFDEAALPKDGQGNPTPSADGGGIVIEEILPRKNALIRPPMANLDMLFITFAAAHPTPALETVDKLISIAEYNHIQPVIVIGKRDMSPAYAEELKNIYTVSGFPAFSLSASSGEGVAELRAFLQANMVGKTAAFAGASGVGKSTLLNTLFPFLSLQTGEISRRIARGRHTTRRVELYPLDHLPEAYIADTPGFSMLDFVRFDFFTRDDVVNTMREFLPYIGACRYKKCTHTREDGCAILEAVRAGTIPISRHQSYVSMFDALKNKHEWSKK
ncbi:MAG: ribosome small subunit-dependent GTPase A [Ruminococcaceae bacterium]|nr:ribosome small subunit-dependent GTPase A [Oscillospiraceae bacterium]